MIIAMYGHVFGQSYRPYPKRNDDVLDVDERNDIVWLASDVGMNIK